MKSYGKPTNELVEATVSRLSSPQHEAYFFARLENPFWIAPLVKHKFFKYPPKVESIEEGYVRYTPWPASRYLARMASTAPDEVATVLAAVETDNPSVVEDMIKAALAMPAASAVKITNTLCKLAKSGILDSCIEKACSLCAYLGQNNQVEASTHLFLTILRLTVRMSTNDKRHISPREFEKSIRKVLPFFASADACKLLQMLCCWLKSVMVASGHKRLGSNYSYVWRPAVEEHRENKVYEFGGVIVGITVTAFDSVIREGQVSLVDALQILSSFPQGIFVRIGLHLTRIFSDQNLPQVVASVLNRHAFDSFECKHEYALLVGGCFGSLSQEQQREWLAWVDSGPNMTGLDESVRRNTGREASDSERADRVNYWKYEKLHWIRTHLSGERRTFYDDMHAKHGEPKMADLNVRSEGGSWGHKSPITVEILAGLAFDEAVEIVSAWKPTGKHYDEPSVEGLSDTFRRLIATDPKSYSAKADILTNRPPIYVRNFIAEMCEALKGSADIDIPAVLRLCHWVVSRPTEERVELEDDELGFVDRDWKWTREEVSRFVGDICEARKDGSPRYSLDDYREPVRSLLRDLCRDSAESGIEDGDSEQDPRVHDYLQRAINSARGKALEALLEYARWVAGHIRQSDGSEEVVPGGFDAMPEVRQELEWHLASGNRTYEAMAIIGSRLSLIIWIDKKWLEDNAAHIFRLEKIHETFPESEGWAAWNSYLVWVGPRTGYYELLKAQYAFAVEQASSVELQKESHWQPMYHLGEHLMVYFGRGRLTLDDETGPLRQFLKNANPEIRCHAIGFVGDTLEGDEEIPQVVIDRFMELWGAYWAGPGKLDVEVDSETAPFESWFLCGKFPEQWALDCLDRLLLAAPKAPLDDRVVERLAEIAQVDVEKSVRILDALVRSDREGWRIQSWTDSTMGILGQAMEMGGAAQQIAEAVIDYLGRRGYIEFGKLLR